MREGSAKREGAWWSALIGPGNAKIFVVIALVSLVTAFFYSPVSLPLGGDDTGGAVVEALGGEPPKAEAKPSTPATPGVAAEPLTEGPAVIEEEHGWAPAVGIFFIAFVLLSLSYTFAAANIRKAAFRSRDLLFMAFIFTSMTVFMWFALLTAGAMAPAIGIIPEQVYIYMIPVAVGPMLVMLFLSAEAAFIFASVLALIAGAYFGSSLEAAVYFFVGSVAASLGVRFATQRSTVIKAGAVLGAVNAVVLISLSALEADFGGAGPIVLIFTGLSNGIVTAVITVGVAPLIESLFRYKTSIKLLELSRMDHPLLRKLAVDAPGTYHHSILMGTLVEAAAESIGANALLARVAAYYHDIGKSKKPLYFIENMRGENKHDKLAPSMSALIISNHLKDGVELAKAHRLGREITDIIREHHGTTLMKYFYDKAKREAEAAGDTSEPNEIEFRYPGPKPQTKESGLVMLADSVEAASKTLPDPSPDKIQGMTQKIINRFFIEGQLDECELTLKDLHLIGKSFNRVFSGVFHHRIDYPEPAYITGRDDGARSTRNGPDTQGKEGGAKKGGREGLKRLGLK